MWKTHGWPACAILVWLIITIPHYPNSLANPLGPYEKFRATDWWKWWKMIKKWKNLGTFTIFVFFDAAQNLSCAYRFFFKQFSLIFQGNRGTWIKTWRKWWKKMKNMIKNDLKKIFNWIYNPWLPKNLIYMNNCISWETWPMPESSGASRRIIRTTRVAKLDIGVNLTDRCGKPMVDQRVPS